MKFSAISKNVMKSKTATGSAKWNSLQTTVWVNISKLEIKNVINNICKHLVAKYLTVFI